MAKKNAAAQELANKRWRRLKGAARSEATAAARAALALLSHEERSASATAGANKRWQRFREAQAKKAS